MSREKLKVQASLHTNRIINHKIGS